ncbi:hypothetical protein LTR17_024336 [Elasticomyces elasticus]|nr:hypothetical protein LTR17_024336 [Elasticomyces elasticus]
MALARDDGLPFSYKLKHVPDAEVPQTALWTAIAATLVITCIDFGAAVCFTPIMFVVSGSLTAHTSSPSPVFIGRFGEAAGCHENALRSGCANLSTSPHSAPRVQSRSSHYSR